MGGTRAFTRHHAGTERGFRRTRRAENLAIQGLFLTPKDGRTLTGLVISHRLIGKVIAAFGIPVRKG